MAAFQYTAIDADGKKHKGVLEADNARQLRQQLRDSRLVPLTITPVASETATKNKQRLSTSALMLITHQMATLLSASIPIDEMLSTIAEQTEKQSVKRIILGVRSHVLEGYPLADSLGLFPKAFPKIYQTTVASGEKSGQLSLVLEKLAIYIERQRKIKQKIKQAMLYPTLMTTVSIGIVIFLVSFVVPKMTATFAQVNMVLPLSTRFLVAVSNFFTQYGLIFFAALIVTAYSMKRLLKRPAIRFRYDALLLKIPFIGSTIRTINEARFGRTFGILTAASVPVLEGMTASNQLVSLLPMHKAISEAINKVREGISISRALKETRSFAPLFVHLVASGENSGRLETMLEHAATTQEDDVNTLIENLLTLFEPILILVMGSIVLFIVLAIMLPIFQMDQFTG